MPNNELIEKFRKKMKAGGVSYGGWMQIPSSDVAEIMADSDFDWVVIDCEHGAFDFGQLPNLCRSLELGGVLPLVRVPVDSSALIKRALDAGAAGILVPNVESGHQAEQIVASACWPPHGTRGVGFSRANLFGKYFDRYKEFAARPIVVVMIESREAIDNIGDIAAISGLDALLIGPYDLSASLGETGNFESREFKDAVESCLTHAKLNHVPAGYHVVEPDVSQISDRVKQGYRFVGCSLDAVILRLGLDAISSLLK